VHALFAHAFICVRQHTVLVAPAFLASTAVVGITLKAKASWKWGDKF
jgi:hypothetical protein